MKEEKTQGIDTETTAKDRHNTGKKAKEAELLDLRAGYCQHTSPNFPNTTLILNVLVQMKSNNKSDYTIKFVDKALTYVTQHVNLGEPEEVKSFIANLDVSNGYKKNLCLAYNKFCKYYKIKWEMPLYEPEAKLIKIPTKEKLEMLISSA